MLFARESKPVVQNLDLERYLGKWYEVIRLDHRFERGLSNVTATYELKDDGTVRVINQGFRDDQKKWKKAVGSARLAGEPGEGRLKVMFFWPFYGGYNILELDPEYGYALVGGDSPDYLWILSRDPTMDEEILQHLLRKAAELSYDLSTLIRVSQEQP